jgi:deoxyadenosine/deoxycytidine kinase
MDIKKHIGHTITKLRKAQGITQRDLAKEIDYSPSTMSQLESGQFQVPIEVLNKLAKYFQVPVDTFFPGNNYSQAAFFLQKMEKQLSEMSRELQEQYLNIKQNYFYVSVTGNIGVGKKEITKYLATEFNGKAMHENDNKNLFLEQFYKNPSENGFMSQLFFLSENFYQQNQVKNLNENIFQGRTLWDNYNVFAKLFRQKKYITDAEFYILERFYKGAGDVVRVPDLIIYIDRPIDTLLKGINNPAAKKFIDANYLREIRRYYENWLDQFTQCKVQTFKFLDDIDLVEIKDFIKKFKSNSQR